VDDSKHARSLNKLSACTRICSSQLWGANSDTGAQYSNLICPMHSLLELTQKIRTKSVLKFCRKVHKHTNTHSESDRQTGRQTDRHLTISLIQSSVNNNQHWCTYTINNNIHRFSRHEGHPACNKFDVGFVGGDILTGALHDLQLQLSAPLPSSLAPIKPVNPGTPGKWPIKWGAIHCQQQST